MEEIDSEKFLQLAKPVMETDYYKNAEWRGEALEGIVDDLEEGLDENYDDDDAIDAVEELVYADMTRALPKSLRALVEYVYDVAVEAGDARRINNYGALYYDGRIGKQDFAKAAHYYEMAAGLGDNTAVDNLGYIYYYGRTGEVDYEKAYQWFTKGSAAYGSSTATYKLGDMFKNGYYVKKDPIAAFNCYLRAEKLQKAYDGEEHEYVQTDGGPMPDIMFRIAECYHKAIGTDADLDKALAYYQKAERGFIGKVRKGNYLVKKMLTLSIDRQEEIRNAIAKDLPQMEWAKKNTGYKTV